MRELGPRQLGFYALYKLGTDAQVRIITREREKGRTQEQAAVSANLRSRKTVAKYERLEQLPSELEQPRQYCTRPNPFTENW